MQEVGKQVIENMFLGAIFSSSCHSLRSLDAIGVKSSPLPCLSAMLFRCPMGPEAMWPADPLTSKNRSQNKPFLSSCFLGSLVIVMKDTANTLPVGLAFVIKTQPQ